MVSKWKVNNYILYFPFEIVQFLDSLWLEVTILGLLLIILRFIFLIHKITSGHATKTSTKRKTPAKTVICIGSGGHTTEILELVKQLNNKHYSPRLYIVAKSDSTSISKIQSFESKEKEQDHKIIRIPRSRVVGQSYITSTFTTLYSILYSIPIMIRIRPDLILCNGPGTCIPICAIAFILKAAFICDTRIIFIESFCRIKTFSLTGKILIYIADNIVVQWPTLRNRLERATYLGQLL